MTEVYRKITVDLSRRSGTRIVFARQNDIGCRNLLIKVTDDGAPYKIESNNSVSLIYKRPDEVAGAIDATVLEDGTVLVEIAQVILRCIGEVACSVSIFDGSGNKITSSDFYIDVTESYYSGESLADDPEYELLHSLFAKVSAYKTAEAIRIDAEEKRVAAERARAEAEVIRNERINDMLGVSGEVILTSKEWDSDLTQTLTIPTLKENDLVVFYPSTVGDRNILANYGVFVSPDVLDGCISVSAVAIPIADISLRYFITRGRVDDSGEV